MRALQEAAPSVVLRPSRGWVALDLAELWRYRELIYFLTRRDISVRYKQTVIGVAWAVLQPLLLMLVFSLVFGGLVGAPSAGVPYPLFVLAALLPWQLFAYALTESGNSLIANQRLVTKVYFPRLVIPIAATLPALADFIVAFGLLLMLLLWYGRWPTLAILTLPLLVLLALVTAFGAGVWLSALNVEYRDVRYAIPFLTQLWLFATPVAYPSELVPASWRFLYALNPLTGVAEGFRWALVGSPAPPFTDLITSTFASLVVLVSGLYYFRRLERTFADVI